MMTGVVKPVLVSAGPLEQNPAGFQDWRGQEHRAGGGHLQPAGSRGGEKADRVPRAPAL